MGREPLNCHCIVKRQAFTILCRLSCRKISTTESYYEQSITKRNFVLMISAAAITTELILPVLANSPAPKPLLMESSMTQAVIQGPQGKLAAIKMGSGARLPLLFVHADQGRALQWDMVMTLVSNDRVVAAYDSRGSGQSAAAADGDYSYEGRAADLGAVADSFEFKTFVIVAHSAGAAVTLAYAAHHSDRVVGIVMVDPATDPRVLPAKVRDGFVKDMAGSKSLEVFTAYVGSIAGKNDAVRKRVLADAAMIDPAARAGIAKAYGAWNPENNLKAYKGPIFVLSTPATDTAGALYRLRPDIQHEVVQTEGHWLQLDHPEVVAEAIKKFVAKVEASK